MRHCKRGNMRLFVYYLVPFLDPDPNNLLGFGSRTMDPERENVQMETTHKF